MHALGSPILFPASHAWYHRQNQIKMSGVKEENLDMDNLFLQLLSSDGIGKTIIT